MDFVWHILQYSGYYCNFSSQSEVWAELVASVSDQCLVSVLGIFCTACGQIRYKCYITNISCVFNMTTWLLLPPDKDFNKHNAVLSSKIDLSLMLIAYASKVDPL